MGASAAGHGTAGAGGVDVTGGGQEDGIEDRSGDEHSVEEIARCPAARRTSEKTAARNRSHPLMLFRLPNLPNLI